MFGRSRLAINIDIDARREGGIEREESVRRSLLVDAASSTIILLRR
jgi:hypothetical protein